MMNRQSCRLGCGLATRETHARNSSLDGASSLVLCPHYSRVHHGPSDTIVITQERSQDFGQAVNAPLPPEAKKILKI